MKKGILETEAPAVKKGLGFSIRSILSKAYHYNVITIRTVDYVKIPKEFTKNVDLKTCEPVQIISSKETVKELLEKTDFFDNPVLLVSLKEYKE